MLFQPEYWKNSAVISFSSQNVVENVGILVRKADVIKNIQEFQSEEFVKLEKPEDYLLSSYEKHRINSKLKISKSSYIISLTLDEFIRRIVI